MDFHHRTIQISLPPNQVQTILLGQENIPYINGHDNFFKPLAVYLNWSDVSQGKMESSVSYFRSKNLCVFRIFAEIEPTGNGSQVVITSGHGPWSGILMKITWGLGFLMCLVGAIIPWLQTKSYSRQLKNMVDSVAESLEKMGQ